MSSSQQLHSLSELGCGEMDPSHFVDNSFRAKRSKRSRPSFSVFTASGEDQSFCSEEEEEEEEEQQHLAAYSLMMLAHAHGISSHSHPSQPSAGTVSLLLPTKRKIKKPKFFDEADADSEYQFDDVREGEKRYKCKTCSKKFFSFQALGGHRASCHNKYKPLLHTTHEDGIASLLHTSSSSKQCENPTLIEKAKIHECPICQRVFTSGQAMGGHKRSHNSPPCNTTSISTTDHSPSPPRHAGAEHELDLNMPAPDDDCNETEESVSVSLHYAKPNYDFGHYWWTENSGKRMPSLYNGVVVGRDDEYETESKAVGFKPDLFLVAPVN